MSLALSPGAGFPACGGSRVINRRGALHAAAQALTQQYVKHQAGEARPSDGALDIGRMNTRETGARGATSMATRR